MEKSNVINPHITLLKQDQLERIHSDSLKILSDVGVRIDSRRARKIFSKAIGPNAMKGDIVRIPKDIVKHALEIAPSTVDLYNRDGDLVIHQAEKAHFGIGVTALFYQHPETDNVEPFSRKHMEISVRLADRLNSFDFITTPGILQDIPPNVSDLFAVLEMTANTTKPLAILISARDELPVALDLLETLHGDLTSKPFIVPFFTPITPLVMDRDTMDKMLVTIERGLPFIYLNYGMVGATTPITPAGTLTLLNAELLAGLTLSQLIKEGTPIIPGYIATFMDMKSSGSFYDSHSYLIELACADLMSFYRLPHIGTSGSTMGYGADIIAAGHQWLNHIVRLIGKGGLAAFVGNNFGGKVFSPNVIVFANEVIAQARRFAQGFEMDDSGDIFEEIAKTGPGGNFLTSDLTYHRFSKAYFQSEIFPQLTLEDWQTRGCPQADALLRRYTTEIISGLKAPDDHAELMAKGLEFIRKIEADE